MPGPIGLSGSIGEKGKLSLNSFLNVIIQIFTIVLDIR